jgi:uncharacterized delta-60 repeat protein
VLTDLGSGSVDAANAVAVQPNGKIVAAGVSDEDFALVRYEGDGSLDAGFGSGGKVVTDFGSGSVDAANAVAVQANGKIVAAGYREAGGTRDFALVRFEGDGSLDAGFGSGGKVVTDFSSGSIDTANAVAVLPNGKIVAAGVSVSGGGSDFALVRYNADGSLDSGFGSGGKVLTDFDPAGFRFVNVANAVAVQPNGTIVAAGFSGFGGNLDFALVRYNADGSLDSGFGSGGKVLTDFGRIDSANGVAVQPNGMIVAAGVSFFTELGGRLDIALVRYNGDGSPDAGFGSGGKVLTDFGGRFDEANAVALQSNGKIVAAGSSCLIDIVCLAKDFALVRYNADGSPDTGFGADGKVLTDLGGLLDTANAVALEPNGMIVAAGYSDARGSSDFALVRYSGR